MEHLLRFRTISIVFNNSSNIQGNYSQVKIISVIPMNSLAGVSKIPAGLGLQNINYIDLFADFGTSLFLQF